MRMIRYRAKVMLPERPIVRKYEVPKGQWVYGEPHTIDCPIPHIHTVFEGKQPINKETVGQFSGAFDCEGREIYEGDILSACYGHSPNITEVTGVVEFVHCGFALKFGKDAGVWLDQLIHAEIIGNIHDNPELMEGGEKCQ